MHTSLNHHPKNIFLVIGFARSGTSVITRGLKALGIDLGKNISESDATSKWNPKGFWEDQEVTYKIHTEVYATLGHGIRGIRIIQQDEYNNKNLENITTSAVHLLNQRFTHTQHWGFKDPLTAKILPFWQSIFASQHINDHYIIALRNPLSSAHSHAKLTRTDIELSLILWLTHLIPAVDETIGKKRIVVSYELMMQDPLKQLLRMKSQLNIDTEPNDLNNYITQFLSDTLHRHRFNDDDLKNNATLAIAPLCLQTYNTLMKAATDEWSMTSPEFISAWKSIKNDFEKYYPIYCYLDTVLKNNKQLKLTLRNINKSIIWKILYPIRFIDDQLRHYRTSKRMKRRLQNTY